MGGRGWHLRRDARLAAREVRYTVPNMMWNRNILFSSSLALVLGLAGCGGAPPAQDASGAKKAEASMSRQAGRRSASDAMKKAWPADELEVAIYIDADGLMKTKLVSGVVSQLLPIVTETLSTARKACLDDALKGIRELAIATTKSGQDLLVARVDPAAAKKVGPCVSDGGDTRPATVNGAAAAWTKGNDVIAVTSAGLLAYGPQALVEGAIAGRSNGKTLEAVSLDRDEYIAWTATILDGTPPMHGSVLVSDDRFLVRAEGDAPDEALAERIAGGKKLFASSLMSEELPPDQAEAVKRLVAGLDLKRSGRHLAGRFELHGTTEQMASDLGTGTTIAVYAVRQYLVRAKQAEAKNVVAQLARILSEEWKAAGPAGAKKKLVSYPPVPKDVPKGAKYQSSSADWKPWSPLKFEMTTPQYYQYEIKAAKDGRSADIIARGDLNGDGTTSEFKLTVKVGPDGKLQLPEAITETNPNE
jgi:hypothetical protein